MFRKLKLLILIKECSVEEVEGNLIGFMVEVMLKSNLVMEKILWKFLIFNV